MHQILFRLGLRPRPQWRSLQRSPISLAGFKWPTSKGEERGKGKGGEGKEGKRRGGNVEFHHLLFSNLTADLKTIDFT